MAAGDLLTRRTAGRNGDAGFAARPPSIRGTARCVVTCDSTPLIRNHAHPDAGVTASRD